MSAKLYPLVQIEKYLLLLILTNSGVNQYVSTWYLKQFSETDSGNVRFFLNRFNIIPVLQKMKRFPKIYLFAKKRFL